MSNYNLKFEESISISKLDNMIAYRIGLSRHDSKNRLTEQKCIKNGKYITVVLTRGYKINDNITSLYSIKCNIPNNLRIIKNPITKNYELKLLNFEFENIEKILEDINEEYNFKLEDL